MGSAALAPPGQRGAGWVHLATSTDTRNHILLVDDEPGVAQVLSQILEGLGYRVTVCTANPFDLPPRETWPAAVCGPREKPFNSRQLAERVEQALQLRPAPAAPAN